MLIRFHQRRQKKKQQKKIRKNHTGFAHSNLFFLFVVPSGVSCQFSLFYILSVEFNSVKFGLCCWVLRMHNRCGINWIHDICLSLCMIHMSHVAGVYPFISVGVEISPMLKIIHSEKRNLKIAFLFWQSCSPIALMENYHMTEKYLMKSECMHWRSTNDQRCIQSML